MAMEAPELFQTTSFCPQQFPNSDNVNQGGNNSSDQFLVEDFFDFSNNDVDPPVIITDNNNTNTFDSVPANSTDSSAPTPVDSTNSSSLSGFLTDVSYRNSTDSHFSGDLSVPYDDLAELEWLSNFTEESFSTEDMQKMQLLSGIKARNDAALEAREFQPTEPSRTSPVLDPGVSVPIKARSKRNRGHPCNWASRLLVVSPTTSSSNDITISPKKPAPRKRDEGSTGGEGRKCLHCATDKTPQWRTGPMGPKTLCNACGVRYKSGRLVPEYRPAASPTFVLTKHSNSHRKVMELRRQKEMMKAQQQHQQLMQLQQHQNMMFDVSSSNGDDYLIHQHVGPDFTQLI